MKRTALVFPLIAVVLAVVVVAPGPFTSSMVGASSSPAFEATFSTADDFYERFDHGYSGPNPWQFDDSVMSFHGDHNAACEAPTTSREVSFGGDRSDLDYSQVFWHCAPGGDPAKGHLMTAVNTIAYNIAWFSPKPLFTGVTKVCWDQNLTRMSERKWTQVMFVPELDATRYPAGQTLSDLHQTRGSGGYDLGFTNPEFRQLDGPTTALEPGDPTFAGVKVNDGGVASWFERDAFTSEFEGTQVGTTDKATRYEHCLEQTAPGEVTFTQARPGGTEQVVVLDGEIPQGPLRVVFQDDNYDPPKGTLHDDDALTWHWDNVEVYAASTSDMPPPPPTTAPPPTGEGLDADPSEQAAGGSVDEAGSSGSLRTALAVGLGLVVLVVAGVLVFLLLGPMRPGPHDPDDPMPPLPDY